ncbi:MAG: aldo/keto reductase [Deferribacteres bacterium]|nr:aldo/keto reductase [candidate division KSB1 bacterium]MCB9503821.1 aldo/keto reductase [Deferribacteres bacterium]
MSRRQFLQRSAGGAAALAVGNAFWPGKNSFAAEELIDRVVLGKSGIETSRLAFGTGSFGWEFHSQQTDLGMKGFAELLQQAYDHGVSFMDLADIYGSHRFFRNTLKFLPREKLTVLTKIWTRSTYWLQYQGFQPTFDRFRKETGCDYFDIVLIHCRESGNWEQEDAALRDAMSAAKERGEIRAVGVSCHTLDALKAAAKSDWVDVILTRINNQGARMDGPPEVVMPVLKEAHDNGKGIVGMKIFGCGKLTEESQRDSSLHYVLGSGNVDAMTIGVDNIDHLRDNIRRINSTLKSI